MSMESDIMFLISQIADLVTEDKVSERVTPKFTSLFIQIISLVSSMDLESQPKPDSKFISLMKEVISLVSTRSNSEPQWEIISKGITGLSCIDSNSDLNQEPEPELVSLVTEMVNHFYKSLDSQLGPLIIQIFQLARVGSLGSLISLSPQLEVEIKEEKFRVRGKVQLKSEEKRGCRWDKLKVLSLKGEVPTHFHCEDCNGVKHKERDKAPVEVKHHLHPKHSLQLVMSKSYSATRECYCCNEDLKGVFYYCFACDFAMNIVCVEKPPVLSKDYTKWHEHPIVLFSRHTPLTCDVCALTDSACPFYICPPCGFVVHLKCINLPRVIRISRHPHQISFTPSFDKGDWSCGVCRRKINNDYGSYSCIKKDCSYAVHSRCATQSNVWDGIDLDGLSEEIEEEVPEPFFRISNGIIQHFSHQHHYLRLDDKTDKDYDDSKQCQACITPIYFGNIYLCMQCDFILHEKCVHLSRKLHHPIHPHMLTLVGGYDGVIDYGKDKCSACRLVCTNGFFYECDEEKCGCFRLHVQCATISEPLVHESHMHPLFLTSKPKEERQCGVCRNNRLETFNCIEECNFALCFECATIPHKVRYKHDKHMLTLTYGEETSSMEYWCEACEANINPKKRFYSCDDGCCVTLHIECLIGEDLYMRPNSSISYFDYKLDVLTNSHNMSRPTCSTCKKRCPHNIIFQYSGWVTCCLSCIIFYIRSYEYNQWWSRFKRLLG